MSWTAFFLLLLSVTFHASWNLMAKKSVMSISYYTLLGLTSMLCWLHMQFWTPVPVLDLPGKFYMFLLLSVISDVLYCFGLVRAYRTMEMSTAYPMMRSLPLLLTVGITALFGWGTPLNHLALLGLAVVFIGCMLMPLNSFSNFRWRNYINPGLLFIFAVACGTTGYTVFDSKAQEVLRGAMAGCDISKPVMSLTYYSTRGITLCTFLLICVCSIPAERKLFVSFFKEKRFSPVIAGVFATCCYSMVLLAMNYVKNVSYVQVFRQLGLLIGVAGGIIILKERCSAPKITGSLLIVTGLILTVI